LKDDSLTIGGQAVIEGVMMRSPDLIVTSLRKPDGEIVHRTAKYISVTKRNKVLGIPVLRGAISLFETLFIGIKSLSYSAEVASEEDRKEKSGDAGDAGEPGECGEGEVEKGSGPGSGGWKSNLSMGGTILIALALGMLLFFWLPLVIAEHIGVKGSVLFNIVDGLVRLAIFFVYLALISLWRDMRRVFEYHGAEHKCITTYEDGEELTLDNARCHSTRHRRCGTSFLLVVMVIAIIVFIFLGRPETITDRLRRFALVPLIAGISFEITRWAGRQTGGAFLKIITSPGLLLQKFTTREPSDDQIEVALDALKRALHMEEVKQDVGSAQESP
jgi:uncharacterized protein YqhQ